MYKLNKKEQRIFDELRESVVVVCSVQCQKCKKVKEEFNNDDYGFSERLIKDGWTYKRDRVLCNECK